MTPSKDATLPHLFDRMHIIAQCSCGSIQTLNDHLPQLEGEIEGETVAYETDEFRAIMTSLSVTFGSTKTICILQHAHSQSVHRKFHCFMFISADQANNAWIMITHRSPSLFKKGTLHSPKDFTKSMGLLNTMTE
jgi:hypothetical protein